MSNHTTVSSSSIILTIVVDRLRGREKSHAKQTGRGTEQHQKNTGNMVAVIKVASSMHRIFNYNENEAYFANGQLELSKQNYQKSFDMYPANTNAKDMINKIDEMLKKQ